MAQSIANRCKGRQSVSRPSRTQQGKRETNKIREKGQNEENFLFRLSRQAASYGDDDVIHIINPISQKEWQNPAYEQKEEKVERSGQTAIRRFLLSWSAWMEGTVRSVYVGPPLLASWSVT